MMSAITVVGFSNFINLIVLERISDEDVERINAIKSTMSFDEYAGYSPEEQDKYQDIKLILSRYTQPESTLAI